MFTRFLSFCEGVGKVALISAGFHVVLVAALGGMRALNSEVIELHDLAELYRILFFVALFGLIVVTFFAGVRSLFCGRAQ